MTVLQRARRGGFRLSVPPLHPGTGARQPLGEGRPLPGEMHLLQQVPLGAPHARKTPRLRLSGRPSGKSGGTGADL